MKKGILLFTSLLSLATITNAQKLALAEEFSGENCGPCAALNPAFMALINATGNDSKVLLLKYQSPIPSAGPIYNVNTVFTDNRMDYYSINSAPSWKLNGKIVGSGNINTASQTVINSAAAEITPFTMTVSNPTYSADGQTFTATVTVTATSATTANNTKLRVALAEELNYTTAPGSNGETHFENVVRQMYPGPDGQNLDAAWTSGQTRTYTITGAIPSYVSPTAPKRFLAAFIQKDDATKEVLQAAKTANITIQIPQADVALTALNTNVSNLVCQVPYTLTGATTTIKNTGSSPLTSAKIYYKLASASTWTEKNWIGTVAPGQTQVVTLDPINITTAGQIQIIDSVGMPNGKTDLNTYDNNGSAVLTILSSDPVNIPLANDFETVNTNWVSYAGTGGYPLQRVNTGTSNPLGYNGSQYMLYYPCYQLPATVQPGYYILPKATLPAGSKALDFYVSYAQYQGNSGVSGDRLEVVYSTDCGTTWTRVWMQEKAELATVAPNNNAHRPSGNSSWAMKSIDMTNVPSGAYIAFRATSGYGNDMFIDNINLRTGAAVSIEELMDASKLSLFPNPVANDLNVSLSMKKAESVTFSIVNALGQEVRTSVKDLNSGDQFITIDAAGLASGIYMLNIKTSEGAIAQKFVKQ